MADREQHDFPEENLVCSFSSFEEYSDGSTWEDEEDRLEVRFYRPDVRPYQFEPARELDNDGSNSNPDPVMRDDWVEKIHVICYDRDPSYICEVLPQELSKRLIVHDGFRDVLGWNNSESLSVNTDLVQYIENKRGCHNNHSVAIVIDSLSPMMLHRSSPYTCETVSKLSRSKIHTADVEQVVCLIHGDLHDNDSLSLVEHLATTVVKVMPSALDHFLMATNILHKRISGKIIKLKEHFNLSETYEIQDVTEIKSVEETTTNIDTGQADPTSNLTFNLTLSDREKEARSQVKLPYTYDKNRQDDTLNKSVGEGKIFYQPDEADDFDEEDPDDDLDI